MREVQQQNKLLLENTLGTCSTCRKIVSANIMEIDGKIFLEKNCCEEERGLLENDASFYKDVYLPFRRDVDYINAGMNRNDPELAMRLLQDAPTLVFYITTSCKLDCPICYLKFLPSGSILNDSRFNYSIEKIESLLKMFKGKYIAINGGEPTSREDLPEIIKLAKKYKNKVSIATHGLRFVDKDYAKLIKESEVDNICFSFDGFDDKTFEELRGRNLLKYKLMALRNLKDVHANVWLYMTIKKGLNERDIGPMIKFAAHNKDFIKGIAFNLLEREDRLFEGRLTPSDIYKIIDQDIGIKVEHFKEEKKFRFFLYDLMKKILGKRARTMFSYIKDDVFYLDVSDKKLEPLITIEEYKKYNGILEKSLNQKSGLKAVFTLLKNIKTFVNKRTMKLFIPFMLSGFSFVNASIRLNSTNHIMRIKVNNMITARTQDLNRKEKLESFGIGHLADPT